MRTIHVWILLFLCQETGKWFLNLQVTRFSRIIRDFLFRFSRIIKFNTVEKSSWHIFKKKTGADRQGKGPFCAFHEFWDVCVLVFFFFFFLGAGGRGRLLFWFATTEVYGPLSWLRSAKLFRKLTVMRSTVVSHKKITLDSKVCIVHAIFKLGP